MVAKRATKEVEFVAPIMMVMGMLTFSLAYAAQIALVHHFVQDWRRTTLRSEPGAYRILCPLLLEQPAGPPPTFAGATAVSAAAPGDRSCCASVPALCACSLTHGPPMWLVMNCNVEFLRPKT